LISELSFHDPLRRTRRDGAAGPVSIHGRLAATVAWMKTSNGHFAENFRPLPAFVETSARWRGQWGKAACGG